MFLRRSAKTKVSNVHFFMDVKGRRLSDGQLWFDPAPVSSGNICNQQIRDDVHAREDLPLARITAALSAKVNLLTQKRSLTTVVLRSQSDLKARRELGSVCSCWSNEAQGWSSSEPSHSTWWTFKNGGKFPEAETHLASRKKKNEKVQNVLPVSRNTCLLYS